jgi:hypothetical protein
MGAMTKTETIETFDRKLFAGSGAAARGVGTPTPPAVYAGGTGGNKYENYGTNPKQQ